MSTVLQQFSALVERKRRPLGRGKGPCRCPCPSPRRARSASDSLSRSPSELGSLQSAAAPADRPARRRQIGHGSYGHVYSGVDAVDGEKVAIKCIQDVFRTTEDAKRTLVRAPCPFMPASRLACLPPPRGPADGLTARAPQREMCILRQCKHPNVIACRLVLRPPDPARFEHMWIVLEMCDWDLRKVMNTRMKQWSIEHVKRLLHQTLTGLAYLHGAKVVHRDLKPANILVTASCDVRICDFGYSSTSFANGTPSTIRTPDNHS